LVDDRLDTGRPTSQTDAEHPEIATPWITAKPTDRPSKPHDRSVPPVLLPVIRGTSFPMRLTISLDHAIGELEY
jgi:hypothetical protein